jgi:hypothetical protein
MTCGGSDTDTAMRSFGILIALLLCTAAANAAEDEIDMRQLVAPRYVPLNSLTIADILGESDAGDNSTEESADGNKVEAAETWWNLLPTKKGQKRTTASPFENDDDDEDSPVPKLPSGSVPRPFVHHRTPNGGLFFRPKPAKLSVLLSSVHRPQLKKKTGPASPTDGDSAKSPAAAGGSNDTAASSTTARPETKTTLPSWYVTAFTMVSDAKSPAPPTNVDPPAAEEELNAAERGAVDAPLLDSEAKVPFPVFLNEIASSALTSTSTSTTAPPTKARSSTPTSRKTTPKPQEKPVKVPTHRPSTTVSTTKSTSASTATTATTTTPTTTTASSTSTTTTLSASLGEQASVKQDANRKQELSSRLAQMLEINERMLSTLREQVRHQEDLVKQITELRRELTSS